MNVHSCVVLLCTVLSLGGSEHEQATESPAAPSPLAITEGIGKLLGLPLDIDVGPKTEYAPQFIKQLYRCWQNGAPEDCIPQDELPLSNVDIVRSYVGVVDNQAPTAVQSYNPTVEIRNTMTLNFNTTCAVKPNETLQAAEVRIYKAKLTTEDIAALEERCDLSQLKVQLYLKLHSNDSEGENDSVVLEQISTLDQMELEQDEYFVFSNMTRLYLSMIQDSQQYMLSLRVAIAEPCTNLHPEDIGFISGEGKESLVVGFSKSTVSLTEALARQGMAGTGRRRKRQTEIAANSNDAVVDSSSGSTSTGSTSTGSTSTRTRTRHSTRVEETSQLRENVSDYLLHPCRLYTHTITFEELGWSEWVISPQSYEANFCAGKCEFPLTAGHNTTKHSFIQSIAHVNNPDYIPPPCCVPTELRSVAVIYREGPETFTLQNWSDMRATACGCR